MATVNRPDKISCDAFSDPTLVSAPNGGIYSQFNNDLTQPLVGVKELQLLRVNFINNSLQLNDYNGQLLFVYSRNTTSAIPADGSTFHVVRLHPSWFVPYPGFTAFTKNKYFNNGTELVAALNTASFTGGDISTYNPSWIAGDVLFSFDTSTRKISFAGTVPTYHYAPVPADHPALAGFLSDGIHNIRMNAYNSSNTYLTATPQPYSTTVTMNERLGFAQNYLNRGMFWGANSILGCGTSTGVPLICTGVGAPTVEADSFPILLGSQNLNIYCNAVSGSGQDSRRRRQLIATIPIENAPLGVCSYTLTSVEGHLLSVLGEIYSLQFTFLDDWGNPFFFNPNFNVNLELSVWY
jgi:hypothetical protein